MTLRCCMSSLLFFPSVYFYPCLSGPLISTSGVISAGWRKRISSGSGPDRRYRQGRTTAIMRDSAARFDSDALRDHQYVEFISSAVFNDRDLDRNTLPQYLVFEVDCDSPALALL